MTLLCLPLALLLSPYCHVAFTSSLSHDAPLSLSLLPSPVLACHMKLLCPPPLHSPPLSPAKSWLPREAPLSPPLALSESHAPRSLSRSPHTIRPHSYTVPHAPLSHAPVSHSLAGKPPPPSRPSFLPHCDSALRVAGALPLTRVAGAAVGLHALSTSTHLSARTHLSALTSHTPPSLAPILGRMALSQSSPVWGGLSPAASLALSPLSLLQATSRCCEPPEPPLAVVKEACGS